MPSRALPDPLAPGLADPLARSAAAAGLMAHVAVDIGQAQEGDRAPPRRAFLGLAGVLFGRLAQGWEHSPGADFLRLRGLGLGIARAGYGGYCRLAHVEDVGSVERARRSWFARLFSEAACALLGGVPGVLLARNSSALDAPRGCFAPPGGGRTVPRLEDLVGQVSSTRQPLVSARAAGLIVYLSRDPLAQPAADDVDIALGILAHEVVLP